MSEPTPGGIPQQPLSESEAKQWAGLSHLLGGIFTLVAPLVIWLVFKDRSAFVDAEGKKAVNWGILSFVGQVVLWFIGLGWIVWILGLVYGIINYTNVNSGKPTKYLVDVELIK